MTAPETVGDEVEVPVELTFDVKNFVLKEPGTCAGASGCGHINITVNGDTCNDVEADGEVEPFNEQAFADEGDADLFYCPGFHFENGQIVDADGDTTGEYTIKAQLVNDDEAPIMAAGKAVSDSIKVTVEIGADMGEGGASGGGAPGVGGQGPSAGAPGVGGEANPGGGAPGVGGEANPGGGAANAGAGGI